MKKQTLLLALMLLMAASAFAENVEIGGLWYNIMLNTKEATVIRDMNGKEYSGNIVIPETVEYNGVTCSVTSIGDGAFENCSSGLTSVTIPNGVTSIGFYAFVNCTGLNSVTIPNSVTSIEDGAFCGCIGLTSVTIPNSVTRLGREAFWCCSSLTSVTISSSVTRIASMTFKGCSSLTSVTIPNGITVIGYEAFLGCSSLTSVYIPNSVVTIEANAFEDCTSLTSVTIPNSVVMIEPRAFYQCSSLTFLTLGNNVTNIGYCVFCGCKSLTSVTIPNSLMTIPWGTFSGCTSLTSLTIGSGVVNIEEEAFEGCSNLTTLTIPNNVGQIGDKAFSECSGVTTIMIGNGIKLIEGHAFANCPKLTDVYCYAEVLPGMWDKYISESCTNIFEGSNIENATLHVLESAIDTYKAKAPWKDFGSIQALTEQEENEFQRDVELYYQEVSFPYDDTDNIITLIQGYSIYQDLSELEPLSNPNLPFVVAGVAYAYAKYRIYLKEGNATLEGCYSNGGTYDKIGFVGNGKFVMPEYVHYDGKQYPVTKILEGSIHEGRFGGVSSLVISNSVTEIGDNAFRINEESAQYRPFLTSVVMGNSVKKIGERAFAGQTLLTNVEVNSSVETIGKEAFSKCGLKTIDWKGSIKQMGEGVFSYCDQLETVNLNCEMDTLPKCTFLMCKNLSSVSLGNNIRVLEMYSFSGTEKLTSIEFPTNLEAIGIGAFGLYNLSDFCGLKKLACPSGLKSIGVQAFSGCKLEEISFNEGLEELGHEVFNVELLKDIYCPSFIEAGTQYGGAFFFGPDMVETRPVGRNKSYWEKTKVHVPHDLMEKFHDTYPWSYFTIVDMETGEPFDPSENPSEKVCAKPSITIDNGELIFTCETEDVEYVTTISCYDVGTLVHKGNIKLAASYIITSYAKREGYKNSEIVKATLFWLPKGNNEEIGIDEAVISSRPVLISSNDGTLTIQGAEAGCMITVYDLSGRRLSAAKANGATTSIATTLKKGDTAIVRIGEKSMKVLMD